MRVDGNPLAAYRKKIHVCKLAKTHSLLTKLTGGSRVSTSASGPSSGFRKERRRNNGCADGRVARGRRSSSRVIVKTKCFEFDHADIREVYAPMVVVVYETSFTISKDDKGVSAAP